VFHHFNRVDDLQKPIENPENINWESYARGAVYALQNFGYDLKKVTFTFNNSKSRISYALNNIDR
jgi:hypothetical protein